MTAPVGETRRDRRDPDRRDPDDVRDLRVWYPTGGGFFGRDAAWIRKRSTASPRHPQG